MLGHKFLQQLPKCLFLKGSEWSLGSEKFSRIQLHYKKDRHAVTVIYQGQFLGLYKEWNYN